MTESAIVSLDVGNSRTKVGLFTGDTAPSLPDCRQALSIVHGDAFPWNELRGWLPASDRATARVILAGVRPEEIARLLAAWPEGGWPAPTVVRRTSELPLTVRVEAPDSVGIDRLLNAVAANALRPAGRAAVIVGCGTATTVDLVAEDGAFEGGAILPGLELCARSLHEHTALLPRIPLEELLQPNLPAVGKSTPAAIRSGLLYGHAGAIRELVARLATAARDAPLVLVTGGNGPIVAPHLPADARPEPDLPLRALAMLAGPRIPSR